MYFYNVRVKIVESTKCVNGESRWESVTKKGSSKKDEPNLKLERILVPNSMTVRFCVVQKRLDQHNPLRDR